MTMAGLFNKRFDPESADYDYKTARGAGLTPQAEEGENKGHWPSRDPGTGMLLKGRAHPTFDKAVKADEEMGYRLVKRGGRYYTIMGDDGGDY